MGQDWADYWRAFLNNRDWYITWFSIFSSLIIFEISSAVQSSKNMLFIIGGGIKRWKVLIGFRDILSVSFGARDTEYLFSIIFPLLIKNWGFVDFLHLPRIWLGCNWYFWTTQTDEYWKNCLNARKCQNRIFWLKSTRLAKSFKIL